MVTTTQIGGRGSALVPLAMAVVISIGAADPLPCQPAESEPNWPTFHIMNNVTRQPDGTLKLRPLNDANGIFYYKGIYHVMNQAGGGVWTHVVSKDLAHWAHIPDALDAGPHNSTWDKFGPCDGTVSFPNGPYGFDGTVPIIMYGPDCAQPIPPSGGLGLGDAPRVEPAIPADPSDPYLTKWVKTQPGPVTFDGPPCSFPGRVWKSKNGNYWNMVCAYDGKSPWARYTSSDPKLMEWKLAEHNFTSPPTGSLAGALFHKVPGTEDLFMINTDTGSTFALGTYDSTNESMTLQGHYESIDRSGETYHWAAAGNNGPDPETDTGRFLTVAWVGIRSGSILSAIRSISYDNKTAQLVGYPVEEYALLHNATFADKTNYGPLGAGTTKPLPIPPAVGGALDLDLSFDAPPGATSFGVAVRAPATSIVGAAMVINITLAAPDAQGNREARAYFNGNFAGLQVLSGESVDIRVLVDRPIVEIFVMGGRAAHTFADTTFNVANASVWLFNNGPVAPTATVSAWGMECGWYAD